MVSNASRYMCVYPPPSSATEGFDVSLETSFHRTGTPGSVAYALDTRHKGDSSSSGHMAGNNDCDSVTELGKGRLVVRWSELRSKPCETQAQGLSHKAGE